MKLIAISFTLKGQSFADIKKILEQLSEQAGGKTGNVVLVHGFMPKDVVLDKGFSTEVVDTLKELFPLQINCYDTKPNRAQMVDIMKRSLGGIVYTIGNIIEGVQEELEMYRSQGIHVISLSTEWDGSPIPLPEPTFGEKAVGITFNPGGMTEVNNIKRACAAVIDELNTQMKGMPGAANGERIAMYKLAIRDIQSGCMWGVKSATWQY